MPKTRPSGRIARIQSPQSLAELQLSQGDLDTVLGQVGSFGLQILRGWDYAAGSLVEGGKVVSYGATDEVINRVDQGQYNSQEGPCLDSLRSGRAEYFGGTASERWPRFAEVAAAQGIGSVLSFPLRVGDETIGALNFYSRTPEALLSGQREEGFLFAAQAALTVAALRDLRTADEQIAQLEEGLVTRTMIGQATGLLMAHEGVTSEEAFQRLVKVSQDANLKLREIAERYVRRWEEQAGSGTRAPRQPR